MSNALAIASVTRILKDLLNDTLVNGDISGDVGSDVIVTALPPDRIRDRMGEDAPSQLNLYLHRITPNPALSTSDLPTRDARGTVINRPRLALDLHYLLTAYTNQEFHGEILLGYAMEMFHETPVLARNTVRAALQSGPSGTVLPPVFRNTDPALLADQLELIRITPQTLSMDDMSKLWTAFQTNYRTTVAYTVSVVLIERDQPKRTPLPVLSRGPADATTGRDEGIRVKPDLMPPVPILTAIASPGKRPALRLGDRFVVTGYRLDEGEARIRFTATDTGAVLELEPLGSASPDQLMAELPSGDPLPPNQPLAGTGGDPGAWRIGPYLVDVVLTPAGKPARITNRLPVILVPNIVPAAAQESGGTRITLTCQPMIRAGQPLSVIVGQAERVVEPLEANDGRVSALFAGLPRGVHLPVRLRVAGIDSLLIDPEARPPRFDPSQMVRVP